MGTTEGSTGALRAWLLLLLPLFLCLGRSVRTASALQMVPMVANGTTTTLAGRKQILPRPDDLLLLICCCWVASKPRTNRPAGTSALVSFPPSSPNRMRRLLPAHQNRHIQQPRGATRTSRRRPAYPTTYKKTGQIPPSTEEQGQRRDHDTK